MIKNYEYLLFKRFFLSRKDEGYISVISWFSLTGIALGVAVLIIVMSVMNGFRDDLLNRIIGMNGHINIYSINNIINDNEVKSFKKNSAFNNLKFNPIIESQGFIISNNKSQGVIIKSLDKKDLLNRKKFPSKIISGNIYNNDSNEILIGEILAKSLGVKINDKIKIAIPKTDKTIFGNIPRFKTMTVKGIFNLGMYEYDSSFVYVPFNIGRNLMLLKDGEYNNIEIFIDEINLLDTSLYQLKDFIIKNKFLNLYLISWKDNNKSFLEALKVERNVMFLILILIILIASMNIISGLVIFVKDKNLDIGILKTLGVSKFSLIKIFVLIGSSIGFIGTAIGVFIGIIFCINIKKIQLFIENLLNINLFSPEIYFLSQLPSRIDYWEVIFIAFLALFLSFVSTIYPAIKSSNVDPIKVIRNE